MKFVGHLGNRGYYYNFNSLGRVTVLLCAPITETFLTSVRKWGRNNMKRQRQRGERGKERERETNVFFIMPHYNHKKLQYQNVYFLLQIILYNVQVNLELVHLTGPIFKLLRFFYETIQLCDTTNFKYYFEEIGLYLNEI